jgi:HK97 family phage major capsid protein/HK97 family phage prohead protease
MSTKPSQQDRLARALAEVQKRGLIQRDMDVDAVDVDARTVKLSFSSEIEYQRWFGIEILSHDPAHVDMSRLTNKAAFLWNHNWDDMRGVVETATIDSDRKGRATVRLSRSPAGEQMLQDMADGIITKISVGYMVSGMRLIEERDDVDVFQVNAWMPYEISGVSVPADDTVGVGRSATQNPQEEKPQTAADNRTQNQPIVTPKGIQQMEKILRDASGNLVRAMVGEDGSITKVLEVLEKAGDESRQAQARGQDAERARVRDLTEMGRQYGAVDQALQFIADGKTPDDFRRELLANFAAQRNAARPLNEQVQDGEIGLTNQEARRFSIMTAVRALANPNNRAYQEAAAFEFECSRAAAAKAGKESRGIMIPSDVLNRAFSTTNPASGAGANAIATTLMADQFIELLRHRTWALKRVTTMGGLVGNVDIPRQNSPSQAYWVGEGASPTEGEPGIDQVSFSPKTLAAFTDITRRLMLQSTPDAELIVRNDLLRIMALALDKAVLYGAGAAGAPKGLLQQTGINAVEFAAASPAYTEYVSMETEIALGDADVNSMSYVLNPTQRGAAKTTLKFPAGVGGATVGQGGAIWEPGNTVNGYATDVTNQVNAGDVFFGNWADYIVAMWSGLDMLVDPYSLSSSGGTRIVVFQDVDMNIRHLQSFCYGSQTATPNTVAQPSPT